MLPLVAQELTEQEQHAVVSTDRGLPEGAPVGARDLAGLTQVIDDALGSSLAAVVAVEAPRVELGVAGQIQLERTPVEVVEVDLVAADNGRARRVVSAGIAAMVEELLRVASVHVERAVAGLEEAHAHRLGRVVQSCEDIGLVQTFDVDHHAHFYELSPHLWHRLPLR